MGELDNFYSDLSSYIDQPVAKQSMRLNPIAADIGAAVGTIPEYLTGSALKLYASLVPGYSKEEKQSAIAVANAMEEERFKELRDKLSGRSTSSSRMIRDIGRTAGSLATGAAGFVPDLGAAIGTTIPVTSFGEKGFDILPKDLEYYLRNIPEAPVSQSLGLPVTAKPGVGEKTVGDIFSKISGAAEKYIGEPAVEAGADPMVKNLIGQTALAAIPAAAVRGYKAYKGKPVEAKITETPEGEMVKVGPEETIAPAEVTSPIEIPKTTDASILLHQEKVLLQDKLAETTTAQGKRKINKQIAEIDKSIGELIAQEQAPKYEGAIDELNKYYESSLLDMAKEQTRKAWAEKKARKLAEEAEIPVEPIGETLPGETPQTIGIPSETPDYWSILKGEVPKETPLPTNELPIDKLNNELKAKEAGYPSHEAYVKDLQRQEALGGEGPHGSVSFAPVTSDTITLKQVTGSKASIQGPRTKGVTYEVNIDATGNKTVVKINFDPELISPEKVSAFKEKYLPKETTLQNETKAVEPEVKAPIEDSRFTPDEITLRDNLYDAKESYLDTKEALIDSLTETNPDLLKPERLPDLMKELNNYPEFQKARTAMESAQRILDEHLGAKPGSIESAVAQVLAEQPKVPESRKIGDTLNDVLNIAKETIKGERGELGSREMSPEAKASWERLNQDAQRLGRSIEDHLKSLKFPDRVIKEMTGKMPSAGGTIVKSASDIQKAIDPDNLNSDKTYTHTTRTGEKVLVQFPKVDVATATALYHTPEVGRGPLTNAIYFFDKLGGPWKELYDNYNAAKTQEIRNVKAAEKEIVELRKKYNNQELKDAYIYSVARRAGGIERLQASGIQIPEFVPKRVAELSHSFDSKFAFLFDRLNEMRVRNGLKPVERVKNYITFFGDVNKISEKLGSDAWVMPDLMKAVKEGIADTSFQFAKKADKKGAGIDVEMDILKAYHKYVKTAERHINIQPIVSRGKTYLQDWNFDTRTGAPTDGVWSVERTAPKTATAIEKWLNTIGRGSKDRLILSKEHASLLGKVQRNLSGAYVGANINTVLSQASSLMMLPVAIGIQNIPRGLGILKPKNFELAGKLSNVLDMRSFKSEINNYAENVAEMGRTEGSLKAIREGVMVPAGLLDQSMAAYSWWASYKTALSRGLTKEKAARFADDVTVKTQGSGDIGHVAPIQTSVEGSALTMLQTYKIAFGNFLYHEILANPKISKAEVIKRSTIAFGSMMAMNMAYNALGLKSPNPEPEWDYKKFTEAGFSSPASVGLSAAKFAGQTFMGNQDRAGYQSPLLDLGYQSMKIPLTPEATPSALTNIAATTIGAATGLPTMALKRLATKEGTARFFTSQPEEREGKITPF